MNLRLVVNQSGQSTVEYIALLMVATLLAVSLNRMILRAFDTSMGRMAAGLEKVLKTGRVPDRIWKTP